MPSIITHAFVGVVATAALKNRETPKSIWILAPLLAVLPDLDVVAFRFGISYGHAFGHRGFFHSLFFAFALSALLVCLFWRPLAKQKVYGLILLAFIAGSHGLLDALTNGGLGIALLAPFDATRYFFPWTPIKVSPISVKAFFGSWGWAVIKSEFLWVWLPLSALLLISMTAGWLWRRNNN
ncbi:MAG: metal-dependent hydrolase [Desulfobacteraceae bacterium]|nr:MAG: metal-dependent hydrolase [Desulfobacteraceae bacterium]